MSCPEILNAFALPEGERTAVPFGNGHINNTFLIRIAGTDTQYILQRINSYVFTRPKDVMENIQHVTGFLRGKIAAEGGNPDRETITLVPSRSGEAWAEDPEGQIWRVMLFVPDTFSPELPDDLNILEECGSAFGRFARLLDRLGRKHHPQGCGRHAVFRRHRQRALGLFQCCGSRRAR